MWNTANSWSVCAAGSHRQSELSQYFWPGHKIKSSDLPVCSCRCLLLIIAAPPAALGVSSSLSHSKLTFNCEDEDVSLFLWTACSVCRQEVLRVRDPSEEICFFLTGSTGICSFLSAVQSDKSRRILSLWLLITLKFPAEAAEVHLWCFCDVDWSYWSYWQILTVCETLMKLLVSF